MRIAFVRYNQNTDLDYAIASVASRNTEERLGILEAMVALGHEVTIVSWVSEKHRHVLKGKSLGKFDNSWMRALRWDMNADIQSFDMLFIETASANTMFSFSWDGETVGYVEHVADLLSEAEGIPIMIYHHGPAVLAFPFPRLSCVLTDPISDKELKKLSPRNYRRIFRDIDIWNNYDYTIWHKAYTSKSFLADGAMRGCYGRPELRGKLKFVATDIGYSPRYDIILPSRNPKHAEYDLVYVGAAGTRERIDKIRHYYDNPNYTSLLVGKGWDTMQWGDGVTAPGRSKYHGDVQDHYQRGLACVLALDKDLALSGTATTRHIQSIHSGCVTMADASINGGKRWVGDEFVVSDADDVFNILMDCCENGAKLREVNAYQKGLLHRWEEIVPRALNVCVGLEEPDEIE